MQLELLKNGILLFGMCKVFLQVLIEPTKDENNCMGILRFFIIQVLCTLHSVQRCQSVKLKKD